jgi:Toastrack DUF4097/LiaI-LiaF-like transmembrane region
MSRPRSAGSIFWGLILIGVGLIFLVKNLGYDVPIWTGVARYWPVLLIVWGVIKLVDYARWKRAGEPGPLFGAGEVVLLIIVILSGTALTAATNIDGGFWRDVPFIFDIGGPEFAYSEHYEKDVPAGSSIEIINRYGSVDVKASDSDRITVDVAKTITARDQKDADELSKVLTYSIVEQGGRYRVISTYNRDQNGNRGRRFKTSLTILVPKRSVLTVNNRYGNVDVSGLTGDQQLNNAFGELLVKNISGAVDARNRNGRVVVEDITGAATISNEFDSIEARRIGGSLDVKHRNGSVEFEDIKGDTKVSNAFGSTEVKNVQGSLVVDTRNGSVDATHVEGNVTVENQFDSVQLEDVKGTVSVENRNGNVEVRYVQPPKNNIRVNSKFGDIKLVLPASSAFSLDARTRFATISSNFEGLTRRDDDHDQRDSLTGQVGTGGPEIRIENQNGSIQIEK